MRQSLRNKQGRVLTECIHRGGRYEPKGVMKKREKGLIKCRKIELSCYEKCTRQTKVSFDECADLNCDKNYNLCIARVAKRIPLPDVDQDRAGVIYNKRISRCRVANQKAEMACLESSPEEDLAGLDRCMKNAEREYIRCSGEVQKEMDRERYIRVYQRQRAGMAKCDQIGTKCQYDCKRQRLDKRYTCRRACSKNEHDCRANVERRHPFQ